MEKLRMAIVGPSDSVSLAYAVALERNDILSPQVIVYQDASQVPELMQARCPEFDMWLFSGIVPYHYALSVSTHKPLFYLPHTGSSLYRALLEITYIKNLKLHRISFDTYSQVEVEETFKDISLPLPTIYVKPFSDVASAKEFANHHYELWQAGKIDIAVTCFLATYEKLKELGVPVFRVWTTRSNIRTTLDLAINSCLAQRFKGTQLAIQEIAIDEYDNIVLASSSYNVKRMEMCLYKILIDYAEMLKGSLISRGDGQYTLYSTRGILEDSTNELTIIPILEEISCQVKAAVSGGIGFGVTAYDAEQNAFRALGMAQQKGKGLWMAVTDDREVIGPLSSAVHLKYSVQADAASCKRVADQLNLSVTTVNRLLAVIDKLDKDTFGAEELAAYLTITARSARRILTILLDNGLTEFAGEEMIAKGRPRKLYKIKVQLLLAHFT
ncbi:GTP cyclohydrolase [Sporomusa malonica]|uniref:GTP cyclohydrolase III n=1 Tax=Sporomusa malonica TaxID=112901 RepID=A0A1W2ERF0_9FIRM|nr:GTP cyclohydrolase [Sporomusa malonica]SMD12261.1 hypothetical protein SAMN04488500_12844 [Sporomusa malonica]